MQRKSIPKIKVLVITTTYPKNKEDVSSIFIKKFYERLTRDYPIEVHILASDFPESKERFERISSGITLFRFKYWLKNYQKLTYGDAILSNLNKNKLLYLEITPFVFSMFYKGFKLLSRYRYDVIHSHWILPSGLVGAFLSKLYRIPHIVTSHGSDIYGLNNKLARYLIRIVINSADMVNPVSRAVGKEIKKIAPRAEEKFVVQTVGVDREKFFYREEAKEIIGVAKNKKLLLFVGRLSETKGTEYLIKAINLLKDEIPDILCFIIGEGNLKGKLLNLTSALNLSDRIIFKGRVENNKLPYFYSAADLTIVPSISSTRGSEGLPITLLEAVFCNCRVIASNIGGISEMREHPLLSLLEPADEKALAEMIKKMLFRRKQNQDVNFDCSKYTLSYSAKVFYKQYKSLAKVRDGNV